MKFVSRKKASASGLGFERLERRDLMTTYFVDGAGGDGPGGDDSFNGLTEDSAFATIQRAANEAQPGDTILIRGGVYREEVSIPRSGTEDNPIVFRAFENGGVPEGVTVTATDPLTGFAQTSNPNVYVASLVGTGTIAEMDPDGVGSLLNRHELTVFVNGGLVQEASNGSANVDYLRSATWTEVDSSTGTTVTDSSLEINGDLTGGFIRVRTSDFALAEARIIGHDAVAGTITLDRSVGDVTGRDFLVHDALALVDQDGEWYFREETNQFFLYSSGGTPTGVEVKRRAEAFDTNGNDYLHFRNLTLTGGDFQTFASSAFSGPQSDHLLIEGVHVVAPDRIFGPDFGTTRTALNFNGDNNIIRDSEYEQVWSAAIRLNGSNNEIVNNFIHDAAFNGGGSGGVATGSVDIGSENLISHNTFTRHGRSAIVGSGDRNLYQYNDFSEVALITEDTGAVYAFNTSYGNSVFRFNTFHDIDARLSTGFYVDNFVTDVLFHNNITYDSTGPDSFGFKANEANAFILHYNNTAFNSGVFDVAFGGFDNEYGSRFYNNIASSIDPDAISGSDPTDVQNNFLTTSGDDFEGASTGNFLLSGRPGAVDAGRVIPGITDGFAGAAPDAGAIELGGELFATGHDFDANPTPVYDLTGPAFGQNHIRNPSFEQGFDDYTTVGLPGLTNEIAANLRSDGLNRFGQRGAVLDPGEAVQQVITGLEPNTFYTLGGWAKPIRQIVEAESLGAGSTNTTLGSVRGQTTVGPLQNNDVLVYDNINFGDGSLFDELTLQIAGSEASDSVQVRLDSPTGPLLDEVSLPGNTGLVRSSQAIDVSAATGTRSLYLVFNGSGTLGQLESLRFSNSADRVQLGVSGHGGAAASEAIGQRVYLGETPRFTFRTGPSSTSAVISVTNEIGSGFTGYVDYLSLVEGGGDQVVVDTTQTAYDYDLGTPTSPVLSTPQFTRVSPNTFGDIYWSRNGQPIGPTDLDAVDRGQIGDINAANRDFVTSTQATTFNHRIANGVWRVRVNLSDPVTDLDNQVVLAEGLVALPDVDNSAGLNTTRTFLTTVTDGELNLTFLDADGAADAWALNRVSLELTQAFEEPLLPGDYNQDSVVSAADFVVWRDTVDAAVANRFAEADGNGSGFIDAPDYDVWAARFGDEVVTTTTPLIDATTRNGDFSLLTPNSGSSSVNLPGGRVLLDSGVEGAAVAIPGWVVERGPYQGGNAAFGFDGLSLLGSNGVGSPVDPVLFVNNDVAEIRTDGSIPFAFAAGDEVRLAFDLGTDFPQANAQANLVFDRGLASEFTVELTTRNLSTAVSQQRFTETIELEQAATTVALDITLGVFNSGGNEVQRTQLDNVVLEVSTTRINNAAALAAVAPAAEPWRGVGSEDFAAAPLAAAPLGELEATPENANRLIGYAAGDAAVSTARPIFGAAPRLAASASPLVDEGLLELLVTASSVGGSQEGLLVDNQQQDEQPRRDDSTGFDQALEVAFEELLPDLEQGV